VVVITAGLARKPGMSRDDLIKTNARIVVEAAKNAIAYSPDAILIVVTNPLDVMTYLAKQATDLPRDRVMGMAGVLDSARFQTFIAMELGICSVDIQAMVLGGHGDLMVPLPAYSTVRGIPITELMDTATIERLIHRTRQGGAEIVELMQTGGAYFTPASSTCINGRSDFTKPVAPDSSCGVSSGGIWIARCFYRSSLSPRTWRYRKHFGTSSV
jgi:malate dehydrogenase